MRTSRVSAPPVTGFSGTVFFFLDFFHFLFLFPYVRPQYPPRTNVANSYREYYYYFCNFFFSPLFFHLSIQVYLNVIKSFDYSARNPYRSFQSDLTFVIYFYITCPGTYGLYVIILCKFRAGGEVSCGFFFSFSFLSPTAHRSHLLGQSISTRFSVVLFSQNKSVLFYDYF